MTEIRSIVKQVLSQLGASREARYYLTQYAEDELNFAVIKIGGALIEHQLEPLADALAFLHNLGLMPIVLHGAGPQLDAALLAAEVPTVKHEGLRVTTPEVMAVARPVIYRVNRQLVTALEKEGVRAEGIQHGVFECDFLDHEALGLVGDIRKVDLEAIRDAVARGQMPVVACLGESKTGQVLNINADFAARELIWTLNPHKIIFLTETGGLLDEAGRVISRLPDSASVSLTSVDSLARELFTHRGDGTLIRNGEQILEFDRFDEVAKERARHLLETSFGRHLKPDYFDQLAIECILASESFGAMAIVLQGVDGIPYLDKFAVTPEAQGAGLGAAVWQALVKRCPKLYWRSRVDNPVTQWYFEQTESSFTEKQWVAFTRGLKDFERIRRCKVDCLARPISWVGEDHV